MMMTSGGAVVSKQTRQSILHKVHIISKEEEEEEEEQEDQSCTSKMDCVGGRKQPTKEQARLHGGDDQSSCPISTKTEEGANAKHCCDTRHGQKKHTQDTGLAKWRIKNGGSCFKCFFGQGNQLFSCAKSRCRVLCVTRLNSEHFQITKRILFISANFQNEKNQKTNTLFFQLQASITFSSHTTSIANTKETPMTTNKYNYSSEQEQEEQQEEQVIHEEQDEQQEEQQEEIQESQLQEAARENVLCVVQIMQLLQQIEHLQAFCSEHGIQVPPFPKFNGQFNGHFNGQ